MSGAGFILTINIFVAGLFSVAFFLIAINNRTDRVAQWFGVGYLFGVSYFVFEFLLPLQVSPKLAGYLAFAAFFMALATVNVGLALRYKVPVPWRLLGAVLGVSFVANWFAFDLPRGSFERMMFYQAPYAVLQVIGAGIVLHSRRRQPLDIGLIVVFALSAIQFLSKPFVAQITGGPGASAQAYIGTNYALYSQTAGAVFGVGVGLLMLAILARDLVSDITAQSETDPLSGLFNRRGFEDRVEPGIIAANRGGVPASFIAIDLDHFKTINDTFGHEAGDRVIRGFAQLLKSTAPPRAITARMGGEEFALFLPGTNLSSARLFAEGARAAFANMSFEGLDESMRFTASFGVAEYENRESLSDLRRRADGALYAAKRAGRDRVHVAESHPDTPPGAGAVPEKKRSARLL
ncbi:MAG TPA: GGDEF domain-containing protein [Devosia sp.]|nr:GGDEF domain-containing protein [Devosia sp.]